MIFLIPNPERDAGYLVSASLCRLLGEKNKTVSCTDPAFCGMLPDVRPLSFEEALETCEAVITVGGDGTILRVAAEAARCKKPLLGVNTGNLGYMTAVSGSDFFWVERFVAGRYETEDRMMLRVGVERDGVSVFESTALNDAVLSRGEVPRLLPLSLYSDGVFVSEYRSDGLIFATPTGSTAYSISAGGPVVDPALDALLVTPLCAHTLASRPIVFRPETVLDARLNEGHGGARLTVDGKENVPVLVGDRITVARSEHQLKLVRFETPSFYRVLADKLK